jgi:glycosyltransferase involved in cell wall biosynthesis
MEVLVVDDGSTDESPSILASYGDQIRVIRQENSGLPGAVRNVGILASQHPYVMHLDADDVILPHSTEQLMEVMLKDPEVGLVVGDFGCMTEEGMILPDIGRPSAALSEKQVFYWIVGGYFPQLNPLHRREVYRRCGFYDPLLYIGEDMDMALRIFLHYKVGYVTDIQGYYRVVKGSMSRDYIRNYYCLAKFLKKNSILAENAFYYWWRAQKALGLAALQVVKQFLGQPSSKNLGSFCKLSFTCPLFLVQLFYVAILRRLEALERFIKKEKI